MMQNTESRKLQAEAEALAATDGEGARLTAVERQMLRAGLNDAVIPDVGIDMLIAGRAVERILAARAAAPVEAGRIAEAVRHLTAIRDDSTTPMNTAADIDQVLVEVLGVRDSPAPAAADGGAES